MGVRPGASALRASPMTRFSLHFVVGDGPSLPHVVWVSRVWSLGWQLEQLLSSWNSLVSFTRLWVPSPRIFWLMILECGQSPTCSLNPVYSGAGPECGARSQDCIRVMSLILLDCFMTGKSLNYQYVIRAPKESIRPRGKHIHIALRGLLRELCPIFQKNKKKPYVGRLHKY